MLESAILLISVLENSHAGIQKSAKAFKVAPSLFVVRTSSALKQGNQVLLLVQMEELLQL